MTAADATLPAASREAVLARFPLSRVSEAFFDDMLGVLPPAHIAGVPGFFASEAVSEDIHAQFVAAGDRFYGGYVGLKDRAGLITHAASPSSRQRIRTHWNLPGIPTAHWGLRHEPAPDSRTRCRSRRRRGLGRHRPGAAHRRQPRRLRLQAPAAANTRPRRAPPRSLIRSIPRLVAVLSLALATGRVGARQHESPSHVLDQAHPRTCLHQRGSRALCRGRTVPRRGGRGRRGRAPGRTRRHLRRSVTRDDPWPCRAPAAARDYLPIWPGPRRDDARCGGRHTQPRRAARAAAVALSRQAAHRLLGPRDRAARVAGLDHRRPQLHRDHPARARSRGAARSFAGGPRHAPASRSAADETAARHRRLGPLRPPVARPSFAAAPG